MTEEKWMGLEVEQKQEMGTVGNLCASKQWVNRREGIRPRSQTLCVSVLPGFKSKDWCPDDNKISCNFPS